MKKFVSLPLIILSLFAFLALSADVSSAKPNKKFNLDIEIIDSVDNVDTVRLTANFRLRNNLTEDITDVTLAIISPIDDEEYGEIFVGNIPANDFTAFQATFDIPDYINTIFNKKLRYSFKIKYYNSQGKKKTRVVRAVPEI